MHKGRLTGEFSRAEATQERIMQAATGTVISSPGPDAGVTVTA
jgi:hypothetical protein